MRNYLEAGIALSLLIIIISDDGEGAMNRAKCCFCRSGRASAHKRCKSKVIRRGSSCNICRHKWVMLLATED